MTKLLFPISMEQSPSKLSLHREDNKSGGFFLFLLVLFIFICRIRSDVLGHILPMVGRDWAQLGVAQLFSKIEANGYKLLYLSARAIGQSRVRFIILN